MNVEYTLLLFINYVELASLTTSQLLEKIQALQTFAYQLGTEEGA